MKHLSIKAFRDRGYLQELNRRFLHPLGLALEIQVRDDLEDDTATTMRIQDAQDDPEGFIFEDPDQAKTDAIDAEWNERAEVRQKALGFVLQPVKEES